MLAYFVFSRISISYEKSLFLIFIVTKLLILQQKFLLQFLKNTMVIRSAGKANTGPQSVKIYPISYKGHGNYSYSSTNWDLRLNVEYDKIQAR